MNHHYSYDIKIPPNLNLRESLIINKIIDTLNDRYINVTHRYIKM